MPSESSAVNTLGPPGVRVWRGGEIESIHRVHAAVAVGGDIVARHGDPETRAWLRSAAKPIQLLPLVEEGLADRFGFTGEELAVMAASHNAEPYHLAAVRSILEKAGLEEGLLRCGAHEPGHDPTAAAMRAAGEEPAPIHNNCSGKHAGMLAVCRAKGWPLDSYLDPEHPLQRRIGAAVADLAGLDEDSLGIAVDGCGAPTFALPVAAMARAWASLARADAAREDDRARAVGRILDAMAAHPEYVAGTARVDTDLMADHGDAVVVKTGAEGVFCAALRAGAPGTGGPRGLALKVADGASRAQDVALIALLAELGVVDPGEAALEPHARPTVTNRAEAVVGHIDAKLPLEAPE